MAKAAYIGSPTFIDGYTTLEYIESTGTQYINTGYVPNTNTRVVMEGIFTHDPTWVYTTPFGVWDSDDGSFGFNYSLEEVFLCINNTYGPIRWKMCDGEKHIIDFSPSTVSVDGYILHANSNSNVQANPESSMYLFAEYYEDGPMGYAKMKLYSCKIYDNGTLVRDFVPYKNGDDVGLLDLLTNRVYSNDGTGSFIAGPTTGNVGGTVTADRARKIIQIYIGIDGVARQVRKVYIGDENGKARLVYAKTYKARIIGSSFDEGVQNNMAYVTINGARYREGTVDLEVDSGSAVEIELRHNSGCPASYKQVYLNGTAVFSGTKSGTEYYYHYIKSDTVIQLSLNKVSGSLVAGRVNITEETPSDNVTVKLTSVGEGPWGDTSDYVWATVNGTTYKQNNLNTIITVKTGDTIILNVPDRNQAGSHCIYINGTLHSVRQYTYTVPAGVSSINISMYVDDFRSGADGSTLYYGIARLTTS